VSDTPTTVVVPMPHMGVSVEEGTVVEWLVEVGNEVAPEQALCAIATDKVDTEVVAPVGGVLARIVVQVDESVAVGDPIAELSVGADHVAVLGAGEDVGVGSPDASSRVEDAASEEGGGAPRSVSGEPTPTSFQGSGAAERGAFVPDVRDKGDPSSGRGDGLEVRAAAGRDEFGRFDPVAAAAAVLSFVAGRGGERGGGAALASPVAKRMAAKNGVDLDAVRGTGRGGRIRKADVQAAIAAADTSGGPPRGGHASLPPAAPSSPSRAGASSPAKAPAPGPPLDAGKIPLGYEDVPHEVIATSRVRRMIAEHMVRSRQTAAHMTTEVDVDFSAVVRARAELNAARRHAGAAKLSYLPFIARAACVALADHPELNATFLGERTIHWGAVNLGIAVDTPEGLLVPVVRDCDRLTAPAIGDAIADLAERARTRKLTPDDLAGGTFTLSNPGSVGAVSAPAIINQPQVAILGVPTIQRRAWIIADERGEESIAIRPILRLSVTFDHRAVDGAGATRFAVDVKDSLESWSPEAYT
jgi:pyruvate dehydrogenase E2 component (dihydrolipoamide acetyltransferase)